MSKELFNLLIQKLEDLDLSNVSKWERKVYTYEFILNICFVHMGVRSACIAGIVDHNKESFDIAKSIENYDDNLKMHYLISKPNNKEYYNVFFFNMDVIKKYNLIEDYQVIKNEKYMRDAPSKSIGKVLGYLCPSNITTQYSKYAVITKELKKRYTYGYNIYKKKDNKIIYPYTSLFVYVCYDKKKAKKYYNKAIIYLELLQKSIVKLTDNIHIGMEYKEEII